MEERDSMAKEKTPGNMIQSLTKLIKQYLTQVLNYVYYVLYQINISSVYHRTLYSLHCLLCIQYGSSSVLDSNGDNLGENLDNDSDSAKVIENTGENKDEDFEH